MPRLADLVNVFMQPELLAGLNDSQARGLVEECTRDDRVCGVPEIGCLLAHPTHTQETLRDAWDDFRECTRDVAALRSGARSWRDFFDREELGRRPARAALRIKSGSADEAWSLIVDGVPWRRNIPAAADSFEAACDVTMHIPVVGAARVEVEHGLTADTPGPIDRIPSSSGQLAPALGA